MGPGAPDDARLNIDRLALGTLYLQGTENAITQAQAVTLLPLWQSLQSTLQSETMAQEDTDALLDQIEGAMTQEQNDALANVSQEELMTWAQDQGLMPAMGEGRGPSGDATPPGPQGEPPNPPPEGDAAPPGPQGEPPDLSPEELATLQAERGPEGFGGFGTPMIEAVISMLETLSTS